MPNPLNLKIPPGAGNYKPSFWEVLDGVLGGDTITQSRFNAQARAAALDNARKKAALNDRITALLMGDDGGEGDAPAGPAAPSMSAAPKRMGPVMDEGLPQPDASPMAAPVAPSLPSKRRFNPDRLNQVLAAAAYGGDEGATKAAEVISKLRPDLDKGMYVDQTGRVRTREGYADAAREIAGANTGGSEAAKAQYDVIAVPMPDGSTFSLPRAAYIALQQTGKIPGLGVSQTPGARAAAEAAARAPTEFITYQDAQGRPVTAAKSAVAGGVMTGQDDADSEYQKKGAVAAADRFQGLQNAGQAAPGKISQLQTIGRLLEGVDGGNLSPVGLDLAKAANSLGFKIDPNLGNKEAANALSQQIALSFKDQLPGPLSNADRDFLIKMTPGLTQSAAGRKTMIDAATKVYQRQQQVAGMARQWQQRFGRIDTPDATGKTFDDYLQQWSDRNRLFVPQEKR